jgi:hypothetical protein
MNKLKPILGSSPKLFSLQPVSQICKRQAMPKPKSTKEALFRQWIKGESNFTTDGKIIFCQLCAKEVSKCFIFVSKN